MQLLVSVGGILIMTALAWLLGRAQKVPNLFVDAAEIDPAKAAATLSKPDPVLAFPAAPAGAAAPGAS
jgi:hypothetical protein